MVEQKAQLNMRVGYTQKGIKMKEKYILYKKAAWKVSVFGPKQELTDDELVIRKQIRNLQTWINLIMGILWASNYYFVMKWGNIKGSTLIVVLVFIASLLISRITGYFLFTTLILRPEITGELLDKIK